MTCGGKIGDVDIIEKVKNDEVVITISVTTERECTTLKWSFFFPFQLQSVPVKYIST